jgi:DNA-binding transcriptional LysR family regulator
MNNVILDMKLLRCFEVLMAERSVSRAATRLDLSQPAMSHALGRLRSLFDDPLFLKGHGHMIPTARALELEAQVHDVREGAERLVRKPAAFDPGSARMQFAIMASEHVEYLLASRLMERLQREAPGIDVEFRPTDRERALGWLERGEIDFRLGWWPKPAQTLRGKALFRDRLVCLARKGHPEIRGGITTEQFLQASHVRVKTPRIGVSMQAIDEAVSSLRRKLRIALKVHNTFILSQVVSHSDFIASVPELMALRLIEHYPLQMLPLPVNVPDIRIVLWWHERTHKQAAHRWFRQLLGDIAKTV